jgi:hypothetical protein
MNIKSIAATVAVLAAGAWAQGAMAGVVLSDNFDAGTAQGNWPGDTVFRSIPQPGNVPGMPSVDLVGPGFFDNLAYSTGNSVDLDGSTGSGNVPAGELQSVTSLPTGNYTVSFLLAGNLRTSAANPTVAVSIGGETIDVTPSSYLQPYTEYNLYFADASGQVDFKDLGPSNQQGDLLDNVVVSVPEPATWAMMLVGFGGLGAAMRSRRRLAAATA